jgi:polysaccharide biosynthesis protein PslH
MRVLMISYVMPHRMTTGAEVCTQNYIDAIINVGHELDLVAYTRAGDRSLPPAYCHSAGEWHIETDLAGPLAYLWLGRAYLTGSAYVTTKFRSQKFVRAVRQVASRKRYDCTIIDHTQLGWFLDYDFLPKPLIFSAHNVESRLYADQAVDTKRNSVVKRSVLARDARLLERLEAKFLRQCRQTWVLTRTEKETFAAVAPDSLDRIHVFDLPGKALAGAPGQRQVDLDVGILGGWLWDVNRRGLEWFMSQVVPLLPASFRIHIAGNGAKAVPNPYPNVVYEGFVDSAVEFLRRCRVVVVPTVSGAGVQIKTIEGISAGVPMIITPIGLRGISEIPHYVSIAETAEEMARLIRARVSSPMAPDFEAGASWASSRWSAFNKSVQGALSAMESGGHST